MAGHTVAGNSHLLLMQAVLLISLFCPDLLSRLWKSFIKKNALRRKRTAEAKTKKYLEIDIRKL